MHHGARSTRDGVEIMGVAPHASKGLRKGVVVNIESTVESIKKAVEEAELMAGCDISKVCYSSRHKGLRRPRRFIAIKNGEETQADIGRVMNSTRPSSSPAGHEVIHAAGS